MTTNDVNIRSRSPIKARTRLRLIRYRTECWAVRTRDVSTLKILVRVSWTLENSVKEFQSKSARRNIFTNKIKKNITRRHKDYTKKKKRKLWYWLFLLPNRNGWSYNQEKDLRPAIIILFEVLSLGLGWVRLYAELTHISSRWNALFEWPVLIL